MGPKKDDALAKLSTIAEAVAALGLESQRQLHRLIEAGAPKPAPGARGSRRYDIAAIAAWRNARDKRQRPTLDLAAERAKLARSQRRFTDLKYREARGELVRLRDVIAAERECSGAVRSELMAVSRRAVLAGLPLEHEPLVRRLVIEALRELSETRTRAALVAHRRTEDVA